MTKKQKETWVDATKNVAYIILTVLGRLLLLVMAFLLGLVFATRLYKPMVKNTNTIFNAVKHVKTIDVPSGYETCEVIKIDGVEDDNIILKVCKSVPPCSKTSFNGCGESK